MKKQTREEEDAVARQMSPSETSETDDSWNAHTNDRLLPLGFDFYGDFRVRLSRLVSHPT